MTENRLSYLFYKVIDGTASEAEKLELADLSLYPENAAALRELMDEGWETFSAKDEVFSEEQSAAMLKKATKIRRIHYMRWWAAAAAIILFLGIGSYIRMHKPDHVVVRQTDIAPGKEGAVLILANGSQVVLDSLGNGLVAQQNGAQAVIRNGSLIYDVTGDAKEEVSYNIIRTPKGRRFNISLPDGTKVWLNAASSLRFPTVFEGDERNVEVSGEVYFEVAVNKAKPFRVKVRDGMKVEVLGTHFNVNAYDDDPEIQTTLIEGKVQVVKDRNKVILKPGQQAQTSTDTKVVEADIEKVMAWKQGLFRFDGVKIEEVMKQLERWYDIEVVYENGVPDIDLMGKMTRGVTLKGLLSGLERLGVHYRLEGRKLIILK